MQIKISPVGMAKIKTTNAGRDVGTGTPKHCWQECQVIYEYL